MHIVERSTGEVTELELDEPWDVLWAAFSPDGRRLVTVSLSGRTRLYDVDDPTPVARGGSRGAENRGAVAFMPDGRTVRWQPRGAARRRPRPDVADR